MWVRWTADEQAAENCDDCQRSGMPRDTPTSSGEETAPLPSRRTITQKSYSKANGDRVQSSTATRFLASAAGTDLDLLKSVEGNSQPFSYFASTSLTVALSTSTASASDMIQRVAQLTGGPSAVGCKWIGNKPCRVLSDTLDEKTLENPTVDLN